MQTNNNKKYIFCGYQNILVAIMSKKNMRKLKSLFSFFYNLLFTFYQKYKFR